MLKKLMESLGYTFKNEDLLNLALTHPSVGAENNQRLEFLGDAVLELCISDRIFRKLTSEHEGKMTNLRQHLVCEEALEEVANDIDLGQYLYMEHGFEASGGREMASVLSDAMEAVLAAVYMDGGFSEAKKVIDRLWPDHKISTKSALDAKSSLQEFVQAKQGATPYYELVEETGPAHAREFKVAVMIGKKQWACASGTSKKKAEQAAARKALKLMQNTGE